MNSIYWFTIYLFLQIRHFIKTYENKSLNNFKSDNLQRFGLIQQEIQVQGLNEGEIFEPYRANFVLSYQDVTIDDIIQDSSDKEGCFCNNESSLQWGVFSIFCKCFGESITAIPSNLSKNMTKLFIVSTGIEVLTNGAFSPYSKCIQDLFLESMNKLTFIESGTFSNLSNLRTLYIKQAPLLKSIPYDLLWGKFDQFRILKVVHCSVENLPSMNYFQSKDIMTILDFENNRIKNITTRAIKIKAETVNLEYNLIELVQDWAFDGSNIATLSFKGNRKLVHLANEAFVGLQNLRTLDLSETSIQNLPTKGLDDLETIKIVDTFTLKVFPSVFEFYNLKVAQLTYPHHCCAFKSPKFDPNYQIFQPNKFCQENKVLNDSLGYFIAKTFPTWLDTSNSDSNFETLVEYFKDFLKNVNNFFLRNRKIEKRDANEIFSNNESHFGTVIYNPKNIFYKNSSLDLLEKHFVSTKEDIATGFGDITDPNIVRSEARNQEKYGKFLPSVVNPSPEFEDGKFAKRIEDVKCYPEPDAFNPCEDVMGNVLLRVAVWFVVVATVVANLAVMMVLMSGKFSMTVSKFLMCNLAFADFCMGLYLSIIAAIDLHTIGHYYNYAIDWQQGVFCKLAGFITVFSSELSIFTLTVITLERWYAITYAIHLNERLKLSSAVKIMIGGWIYAIFMASLPLFGVSGYSKTSICLPMENRDTLDVAYLIVLLTINAAAFILISACYGKMYYSIKSHRVRVAASDTLVAKKMALLVFTDFACWAPIAFFGLTAVAGFPLINVTKSKILLVFFYPINSCANPFLYAILTKQYRRDFFILASRYGFCTKHAMKYKGTSNDHNFRISFIKGHPSVPIYSQVLFDGRIQRFPRHTKRALFNYAAEDNSERSVIYSTIDVFQNSNQSTDSNHGYIRIGYLTSDNSPDMEGKKRKDKKGSKFSSNNPLYPEEESSSSAYQIGHKSESSVLKKLSSSESDEIIKAWVIDRIRTGVASGIFLSKGSQNSVAHKNIKNFTSRETWSGKKSERE